MIQKSNYCKLALGTVQFGMDYGVTNLQGKLSLDTIRGILESASLNGIDLLDTAHGYEESEKILGQVAKTDKFSIITKTPNWNGAPAKNCGTEVIIAFNRSLKLLQRHSLYGLMVHYAKDLIAPEGKSIWRSIEYLKASGKCHRVGISFYPDDPVDDIIDQFKPDFVQLPVNIFDQRVYANGQLERLNNAGIEVHARSVFLQGILLSSVGKLPKFLDPLSEGLESFIKECNKIGYSQIACALGFVRSLPGVRRIIVGVTNETELSAISAAFDGSPETTTHWQSLAYQDPELIDPRYWKVR
jgi:aryl-alcohol dehydrogenase-like predicted oxidoreductase